MRPKEVGGGGGLKCGGWRNEPWTFLYIYPTFVLPSIRPTSKQTRSHCRVAYSAIQFPWIASGLKSSVFIFNLRIICRKGALFTKKGSSFCIHVEDYKFKISQVQKPKSNFARIFLRSCRWTFICLFERFVCIGFGRFALLNVNYFNFESSSAS